jgi:SAM-dependent methyltransferase
MSTSPPKQYVLGSNEAEIARLDLQAGAIESATALLVRHAGISEGMRVLDVGTGLGHVAFEVARLVGPSGEVVGIDQSSELLEVAEHRRADPGLANVRFEQADARTFRDAEPFDAVVTRLLLFHLPDAVDVVAHHVGSLRPGGTFAAIDYDSGTLRSDPVVPLVTAAIAWIDRAFRAAGADPNIGAHLALVLTAAGLCEVDTFGVQSYLAPDDPRGPAQFAGVVASLAPQIVAAGIATEEEMDLPTLRERIARELLLAGAVVLPPCVVGAWGRRRA